MSRSILDDLVLGRHLFSFVMDEHNFGCKGQDCQEIVIRGNRRIVCRTGEPPTKGDGMNHHFNHAGQFQSDKHPYLPPDHVLINPGRPENGNAMLRWAESAGYVLTLPGDTAPRPKAKMVFDMRDPANIPALDAVANAYQDADTEFSEAIRQRLVALHPDQF